MTAYTHTGYRPHTGYRVTGRNFGHQSAQRGKVHALNAVAANYVALCGETVAAHCQDNDGDDYYDRDVPGDFVGRHVYPVGEGRTVTCKRCRKIMEGKKS